MVVCKYCLTHSFSSHLNSRKNGPPLCSCMLSHQVPKTPIAFSNCLHLCIDQRMLCCYNTIKLWLVIMPLPTCWYVLPYPNIQTSKTNRHLAITLVYLGRSRCTIKLHYATSTNRIHMCKIHFPFFAQKPMLWYMIQNLITNIPNSIKYMHTGRPTVPSQTQTPCQTSMVDPVLKQVLQIHWSELSWSQRK